MGYVLDYLRPRKQEASTSFVANLEQKSDLKTKTIRNVLLTPLGQIPTPYPPTNGEYIVDDNDFLTELKSLSTFAGEAIRGTTLYGGWLRKVWGHFLMGGMARMWPLLNETFFKTIDNVIFFSHDFKDNKLTNNYLEIMQLLGIDEKIQILSSSVCVECLVIPEISFEHDCFYSSECRDTFNYIRKRALNSQDDTEHAYPKKVFLTRSLLRDAIKNEINIQRLDKLFSDNGFEIIAPERTSISRLIKIFNRADTIASLSGSTAHNLIFDSPDSGREHIIIERHPRPNSFQMNIDTMMRFRTTYVDGFYLPNFSCSSNSVMLFAYTPQLKAFSASKQWKTDAFDDFDTTAVKRRELKQYFSRYRRYFGYGETIAEWEIMYAEAIAEAVIDTQYHYRRWLSQLMPLFWIDYLSLRFLYRFLKNLSV